MKNDATFLDAFLNFLNDGTADARAAEARFVAHPYCAKRLHVFQTCPDVANYRGLRDDMRRRLVWVKRRLTVKDKKKIVDRLNDLVLKVPLLGEGRKPITEPDGKPVILKIGGLLNFHLKHNSVEAAAEPAVTGMEYACWYALLLISREPHRIKRCSLESCSKYFNIATSGTVGYCTPEHALEAEEENKRIRTHNLRNPHDRRETHIATAPKRRKGD